MFSAILLSLAYRPALPIEAANANHRFL